MRSKRILSTLLLIILSITLTAGISCGNNVETTSVSVKRISNGYLMALDPEELNQIPFTDFAIIVDFNTPVQASDQENIVVLYRESGEEWANTTVKVFAEEGTLASFNNSGFFPEHDPVNEVPVETEVLDEDSIGVSPVSGSFPSGSQIVLTLEFELSLPPGPPILGNIFIARIFT